MTTKNISAQRYTDAVNALVTDTTTAKNRETVAKMCALLKNKEIVAFLNDAKVSTDDLTRTMYVAKEVVFFANALVKDKFSSVGLNKNFVLGLTIAQRVLNVNQGDRKVQFTKSLVAHALTGAIIGDDLADVAVRAGKTIGDTQVSYTMQFLKRVGALREVAKDTFEVERCAYLDRFITTTAQ